jgi:carbonic anhydrase
VKRHSIFILAVLLLTACAPAAESHVEHPHWGYEGDGGPEQWAELDEAYEACATGSEQSPVDLANAVQQDVANITFRYQPSQINIFNNGHTIQVNYDEGSSIEVNGETYDLLQFHFHMPSEHTLTSQFLPDDQKTFRYPGSLTTPPCTEGVSWFVMVEPIEISTDQVDQFKAIISVSNRPVQPLGERELTQDSTP